VTRGSRFGGGAAPPAAAPEPGPSYADQLAAHEARRQADDDILLRKMRQLRDPMNPG
jgi:hypothetical protein